MIRQLRGRSFSILALAVALAVLLWPARNLRSENFVFYLPTTRQVVPLQLIEGDKYLPLIQVLNMVGKVSGLQEKKSSLKVWFGKAELELRSGEKRLRLDKRSVNLPQPPRLVNGHWLVPVDFLTSVLPHLTVERIEYQEGTNRIFIGDIRPNSYSVRLDQITNGTRLTLQFTHKVSVRTAASNGKWILFLDDHPIEPLEQQLRFQSPYLSELRFDDQDGVPKLILTPAMEGLNFYPSLAEGGKVLLADVLKPPLASVPPRTPSEGQGAPAAPSRPETPAVAEEAPEGHLGPPLPIVVLDAGHGGSDIGVRARDGVSEKDLVAQYVASVRLALLATKRYRVVLTRPSDAERSFEQREATANSARPVVFLTFHAGNLGTMPPRIAVYSHKSLVSTPSGEQSLFVPWRLAQQAYLDRSRQLAQILQQQFNQAEGILSEDAAEVPVRTLRSISAPAVAIEVGSFSPEMDSAPVNNPGFLKQLAAAVVRALDQFQGGKP